MTISQNIGFIIGYIILLGIAVGFAARFISIEDKLLVKLENVEDSVVVNRIVRCFSKEGEFGVMDNSKIKDEVGREILRKCMGGKYNFDIKLIKMEGDNIKFVEGNLRKIRVVNRYVVVDGKSARLEVSYSKR